MEKEKLEGLLIDYIDGKLNAVDQHRIEQELMQNQESYKLYEQLKEVMHMMDRSTHLMPPSKLKTSFDLMLQEEITSSKKTRSIFFQPVFFRAAAAVALLVLGVTAGFWINQYQRQQSEIAEINRQLKETRSLMMAMLDNEQSPSQRILGVKAAYETSKPDDEVVNALINLMNEDPNSNVRLAAIDALKKFSSDAKVKKAFIKGLSTQDDPVVQIALIQLMVEMKEKNAVKPLQRIIEDEKALPAVKDEAHVGLFKLS